MSVMPYSPIRAPAKHVTHTEMLETLAKRTKVTHRGAVMNPPEPAAQGSEARNRNTPQRHGSGAEPQGGEVQATQPLAAPIEWGKPVVTSPGAACLRSLCGRYRINRVTSQALALYTAWRESPAPGVLHVRLGCVDEAAAAKALCQADADAKAAP
jgi:hypothetical protein